ncbi:MAG TPA: TerB family tellurite resistance protein [Gemmatimonadales bacterium]|nr:TerB family tellurite resistance protein [Gemmatimonadales bacterium]
MLDAIRGFVTRRILSSADAPRTPERPGPSGVQLAACALLLELAYADGVMSAEEQVHIEGAVQRHFGLDEATGKELVALAETERRQSIDHFQFTRMIAAEYDLGQKMVLAEVMWGVILADGQLATHETWLVRKLAHLLELEPGYLSEARKTAAARTPGGA